MLNLSFLELFQSCSRKLKNVNKIMLSFNETQFRVLLWKKPLAALLLVSVILTMNGRGIGWWNEWQMRYRQ